MSRRITVNIGFITNSSSCVYYFPKEILDDPQVKAFIEAYELGAGYVGEALWDRSGCMSFLVTKEQKAEAKVILSSWDEDARFANSETSASRAISPEDDGVYVIYGDEYRDTTNVLCGVLSNALARLTGQKEDQYPRAGYLTDFN